MTVNERIKNRTDVINSRLNRMYLAYYNLKAFENELHQLSSEVRKSPLLLGQRVFAYDSYLHLILSIAELFKDKEEYSIIKLLNHMQSSIKSVEWYHVSTSWQQPEYELDKVFFTKGSNRSELRVCQSGELQAKIDLVNDLLLILEENSEKVKKVIKMRDNRIAHISRDFQKYKLDASLDELFELLSVAEKVFNNITQNLYGIYNNFEMIEPQIDNVLRPLNIYYAIDNTLKQAVLQEKTTIPIQTLDEILASYT